MELSWEQPKSSWEASGHVKERGLTHAEPRSAQRDVGVERDLRIRRLNLSLFPIQICLDQGREDNPGTQNASLQLISHTNPFISKASGFTGVWESWIAYRFLLG